LFVIESFFSKSYSDEAMDVLGEIASFDPTDIERLYLGHIQFPALVKDAAHRAWHLRIMLDKLPHLDKAYGALYTYEGGSIIVFRK